MFIYVYPLCRISFLLVMFSRNIPQRRCRHFTADMDSTVVPHYSRTLCLRNTDGFVWTDVDMGK